MMHLSFRNLFCLLLPAILLSRAPRTHAETPSVDIHAQVVVRRDGDTSHFFVRNSELCEVTMTFDFSLENLKSDVQFPYTATFKPGETAAFTLSPVEPDAPWRYSYTNYYKLGSTGAQPDEFVYSLPYLPGSAFRITQGYNGKFSHKGSNQYAIDWKMPQGTPVCAARGGLVVKIKDDSDRGGGSMKYDPFNNFILIRHDDGTLGHYCHLEKDSVRVAVGQYVKTGQILAASGDTGFSTGPHLHFRVFKTQDGRHSVSIPVQFRDASGQAITLVQGRSYRASAVQTAQAPAVPEKFSALQ